MPSKRLPSRKATWMDNEEDASSAPVDAGDVHVVAGHAGHAGMHVGGMKDDELPFDE